MLFVRFSINNFMNQNIAANRQATATIEREVAKNIFLVAPGVWRMKDIFVNVFLVRNNHSSNWMLVDAGLKTSAPKIKKMIAEVLEPGASPMAIVMTHGHFDHRGSLQQLVDEWKVPVYAHHLEMPYLSGRSSYPPPDSTVGGGAMASLAFMYPKKPINVAEHLYELPENGVIPGLPEWKWIHTPGHTPGHVSLFRESDGVLIAGDAFVTTQSESAINALTYRKHLSGPPKYLTCNWASAKISVLKLAALDPEIVATGHGYPMFGQEMRNALHTLSRRFDVLAQPAKGRYVNEPAVTDETGVLYVPRSTQTV